jgi:CubicO group peptidase (beta-lactamase class C family)
MAITMLSGTAPGKRRRARWLPLALALLSACASRGTPPDETRNPHAAEPIGTVREMYDGRLTPELAATTFRNIDRLFPSRVIARGATVTPLPVAATPLGAVTCTWQDTSYTLDEYVDRNRVTGLLVLKDGAIVLERYAGGVTRETRSMSMSIAKSITSTLVGVAIHDGRIRSLDDTVTRYVPTLRGSAYDGVTVRQVLMMGSGVRWNETYTDSSSDRRHLLEAQIAQRPGAAMALMAALPRAAAPGTLFNYSTGETLIASEVVRGATGMSASQYLSEKVWQPLGMEHSATWWLDSPDGHEIGGSGIMATLRDYARFGEFIRRDGMIGSRRVLPAGWVADASTPKRYGDTLQPYGYMWWPVDAPSGSILHGAFAAQGIFGQYLHINPAERLVIAQWSAQTHPTRGDLVDPTTCFGAIASALHER